MTAPPLPQEASGTASTASSMPSLRALFMGASVGSGHWQAQTALQQALLRRGVAFETAQGDIVEYFNPFERLLTVSLYEWELRHAPWMYRGFYHYTDLDNGLNQLSKWFSYAGLPGMLRDLERVRPDAVISTFWSSTALAGKAMRRGFPPVLNALVVTDYRAHRHWIRQEADVILVAADETREQMMRRGLPGERIEVTGIPIDPAFRALYGADKAALREGLGLRPDVPLILLSAGGTGSYRAFDFVLRELANLGRTVQVLVLAGAGGTGREQVGGADIHRLGFTTEVPALMAASDLVVGKAGGLTVAEATTLGVPLVIHEPIPGQEEYNADFLERHGAGFWARRQPDFRRAVLRALDADEHARLSAGARAVSVPDAAERVADVLLRRLGRS